MARGYLSGGAAGSGSDDCTATKAKVLAGFTAITQDSDDEPAEGTVPVNGSMNAALNCGGSKVIPEGYTTGGTVSANSLASQTSGTATAAYIYTGKTAWVNGTKITGTLTVTSVLSFSVAAGSSSGQIVCAWTNPSKGPFTGVRICAKTGGYPTGPTDSAVYTGTGSSSSASAKSSATITLTAGVTYYVRIYAYLTTSLGTLYTAYCGQGTVASANHGTKVITASGSWTVPLGANSKITIHAIGGGQGGTGSDCYWTDKSPSASRVYGGGKGGNGGCHASASWNVTPGTTSLTITIGAGGAGGTYTWDSYSSRSDYHIGTDPGSGGTTTVKTGSLSLSAAGGGSNDGSSYGKGGASAYARESTLRNASAAGADGVSIEGVLYAAGGGGGGVTGYGYDDNDDRWDLSSGASAGGNRGGGAGSSGGNGGDATAGTGSGGGAASSHKNLLNQNYYSGGAGGSGAVIIIY